MPETNQPASPNALDAARPETAPAVHRPHRLLGAQLGDFLIHDRIARGSMGEVFLATQLSLERKVAVKVVSSKIARNPDLVQRFLREMRWLAQLDHPSIVKVYAAGEHDGTPYAALEFVDGRNLQQWLLERKSLSVADAIHITLLCAEALGHAHSKKIIHRDVKPANILIGQLGEVKLTDFGLVKAAIEDVSLTSTGMGLGTPQYMAPEQIRNAKHCDARTDIYALGTTLYELVTGDFPFPQTDMTALLKAKLRGQITPVREHNPSLPEKLELVLSKMLEKNPDFRYPNCDELLHDLGALGLARESLDFIESPHKVKVQRPWTNVAAVAKPATPSAPPSSPQPALHEDTGVMELSDQPTRTSASPHRAPKPSTSPMWFVRHKDGRGILVVSRMTADEVLRGIETKYLDINATAKSSLKDSFRPLRDFPEFRKPMDKRLSKCKVIRVRPRRAKSWRSSRGLWIGLSAAMLAGFAFAAWSFFR